MKEITSTIHLYLRTRIYKSLQLTNIKIQAALPALRESNGRIVMISSGAAVHSYSTWGAYGASKAAINHLAMTLAAEEPGVTTLSIRPGVVDTGMQQDIREKHHKVMDENDRKKFLELKQEGKLLRPEQPLVPYSVRH